MKEQKVMETQTLQADWLKQKQVSLHVLRLDEYHAVVSGNKWFKLQYYLQDAAEKGYHTIATFGGAYSNHIVATAFACNEMKLNSIGIIRGEKPQHLSHTLSDAQTYGMQLQFISREEYNNKETVKARYADVYWIAEGGYGDLGAKGAAGIIKLVADYDTYTHIVCATGTGTTMAGLIRAARPHQTVIGVSALKNNNSIAEEVRLLLSEKDKQKSFVIVPDYHFGGYAKHNAALLQFMNDVWQQHRLPTDFVYTAKAFFGLQAMIVNRKQIVAGGRVLFIHTGGLQGNLSLGKEVLSFS